MSGIKHGHKALRSLPAKGRLLGVDPGDVRIGLAITDPDQLVATALDTMAAAKDVRRIAVGLADVVTERQIAGVIVGYPRTLAAREGAAARRAREIAGHLADESGVPVILWDERFTTVEAERTMIEQDARRRTRRQHVDKVAATLILTTVLEARRMSR